MKTLRLLFTGFILVLHLNIYGQAKRTVEASFSEPVMVEDFNEASKSWTNVSDNESVFQIENGEYVLNRIHPLSPYAITPFVRNEHEKFLVRSAIKFEPVVKGAPKTSKIQTAGIIFLIFQDGRGAVVLELNDKNQYRLKQMIGKVYQFISGNKESNGWADSKLIKPRGEYNVLEAKVEDGKVDLYINNQMLGSIVVEGYKSGNMGLLIGPDSKAYVDYFYIYTTTEEAERLNAVAAAKAAEVKEPSVEEKMRKLLIENNELKHQIQINESEELNKTEKYEEKLSGLRTVIDSLIIENATMAGFANEAGKKQGAQNPAVLSKSLKEEIATNKMLLSELKIYRDSLDYYRTQYEGIKEAMRMGQDNGETPKLKETKPKETKPKTEQAPAPNAQPKSGQNGASTPKNTTATPAATSPKTGTSTSPAPAPKK